jgi:exopolysaccharide production protein ExoQ
MPPSLASIVFIFYVAWLLRREIRHREGTSIHLWIVVAWICLVSSRPVSTWFGYVQESGGIQEALEEGNPAERAVYLVLIMYGIIVVIRRKIAGAAFIRENKWLALFLIYWAISILWSDYTFVALKRFIKEMGHLIMIVVIITEEDPISATKAAFFRVAAILAPISLLLIKYYPDYGRTYHVTGELLIIGVTTHKNTLGMLMLVCGMVVLWDLTDVKRRGQPRYSSATASASTENAIAKASLLLLWLLQESKSATSQTCAVVGAATLLSLRASWICRNAAGVEIAAVGLGILGWLLDTAIGLSNFIIVDLLGRDPTLTTRTDFWPILLDMSQNALFGSGFNSFWTGERLEILWPKIHVIQSHNGYLETYLNGGLIALAILGILLITAVRSINAQLRYGAPMAPLRLAFILILLTYDVSEAAFNTMSALWFVSLLMLVNHEIEQPINRAPCTDG